MTTYPTLTAGDYAAHAHRRDIRAMAALCALCLGISYLFIAFQPGWYALIAACAVAILLATWARPVYGVAGILALTIFFEEFEFASFRPLSSLVPFFARLSTFTSVKALVISPLELMLAAFALIVVLQALVRKQPLRSTAVTVPIFALVAIVGMWCAYGWIQGGAGSVMVQEIRAFMYLALLCLLMPTVIKSDADVNMLLWVAIAGVAVKAAQGMWAYYVILRGDTTGVQAITSHEDALFIGWMFVLLLALLVYRVLPAHRTALLLAAPVAGITLVLTERRAAYVALVVGAIIFVALLATDSAKRRLVTRGFVPLLLVMCFVAGLAAAYPSAFGRLGSSIASITNPTSTEDIQSNYYRRAEEMDLIVNIRNSPWLGLGFGRPYAQQEKLATIEFSLSSYIPHNEIMWLWMDTGTLGFAMIWGVFGTLIAYGCILFRKSKRQRTKALAGFITAALAMQLVVSYVDLQLTFARNMVFLGVLLAVLGRLQSLDDEGGVPDAA